MGIYIKGMEMPKNCLECPLVVCLSVKSDCPLVPVPPHGDLIDRDELMKHKGNCYDADGHLLYAVGTGSIMCAPTIIPKEER